MKILKTPMLLFFCFLICISCERDAIDTENITPNGSNAKIKTNISFKPVQTIFVGGEGASEITAFDPKTNKLFVVNVEADEISVFDISDISSPVRENSIIINSGAPNSVAVNKGRLAVAVESENKQADGKVLIYDTDNKDLIASFSVGALPDMVAFSPNGRFVVTANEGEPSDDYLIDPKGSVSIIKLTTEEVSTLYFDAFNTQKEILETGGFRIFGPNATLAMDVEPEYITISDNSRTAWVTLQENNGIAKVDLLSAQIEAIYPLGFKDYSIAGNEIDASDKDDLKMLNSWPVYGMYQPDAIDYVNIGGVDYIITANEGDAREYEDDPGFVEEKRVNDIKLDPSVFPDAAMLQEKENLGRLKITTTLGDTDNDGDFDALYSYGTRSFSIWSGSGQLIYDSGNEIATRTLSLTPNRFNDNDGRSDDKGAEPEAVEVLDIGGNQYILFVGLERNDQILVYDISNPTAPVFLQLLENNGDEAPEGLLAVKAKDSPTKKELLIVSNEDSGTVTVYEND